MPNQYKNKVQYIRNGVPEVLVDLTSDTVTPEALAQGYTAHDASGAPIVGTATSGSMVIRDEPDSHGGTIRHITAGSVVTGTIQITSNGTVDVASYADAEVSVTPAAGSATTPATTITANPSISVSNGGLITATASATKSVTPTVVAGYVSSGTAGTITVSGSNTSQLSTQAGTTITPTESEQTAVSSGKYTTGAVKVGAISSTYVGSGIARKSSSDLTVSGATVTAPAGYYSSAASKSIASGTAGTPTASKGSVSNHAVSVTPSVTNTTGYISGGTKTGTAVTVTASELASGNKEITDNGTNIDVVGYSTVSVNVASSGGWDYQPKNDGLTHVWFDVTCPNLLRVGLWMRCTNYTNEYIDWGDGTTDDNFQGLSDYAMHYHTYSSLGTYCVTLSSKLFLINKTSTSGDIHADPSVFLYSLMAIELSANETINQAFLTEYPVLKWVYYHDGAVSSSHDYDYELQNNPSLQYFRMASRPTTPHVIGTCAFDSDVNLIRVDNWGDVTQIGNYAFDGCSVFNPSSLPSALTSIGEYAFRNCKSLVVTSLPSTVTSIGQYAFASCASLAWTSLPSGITSISQYAFQGCTLLALTSLPSGITSIGNNAFQNCPSLALTSLPSGITNIGQYAFSGCSGITLTSLPSSITIINQYAFTGCHNMTLTSLPSGITSIGQYAFSRCTGLTSISCDGVIKTMAVNSFVGNSAYPMQLTSASFPNMALTSNISTAFGSTTAANACQLLEFCDIGSTTGIAANAFANCYALETLVLRKSSVCTLANVSAFLNTPMRGYNSKTGTVYVPTSLISSYRTATNWSTLYNDGTVNFVAIEGSDYELE